ncbi:hypothetical protein BLAT2472_20388 [Burkholderia latens]
MARFPAPLPGQRGRARTASGRVPGPHDSGELRGERDRGDHRGINRKGAVMSYKTLLVHLDDSARCAARVDRARTRGALERPFGRPLCGLPGAVRAVAATQRPAEAGHL